MAKLILHLHFYQPPRENPWTGTIDPEASAAPLANWNERISGECYEPNAKNLSHVSWNAGPTLLNWLQKNRTQTYNAFLQADRKSRELYQGHGSALAHPYHHPILPLLPAGDREAEIHWGWRDFELRFGRAPEGFWLPETAVDVATLEAAAQAGVKFVVLAPHQAARVRRLPDSPWQETAAETLDTSQAYQCVLPSGRSLALFFYHGPLSLEIQSKGLAESGERLAGRLFELMEGAEDSQLIHAAADGETYGHHSKNGADSLFYVLNKFQKTSATPLTNYGAYLERCAPKWEAQIKEGTSWSCPHGLGRWQSDCGCRYEALSQSWRKPLREALDWLAGEINQVFFERGSRYFKDPWLARRDYIEILLPHSWGVREKFWGSHQSYFMDEIGRRQAMKLLEMQRLKMAMFTSCGWFYDDVGGLESRIVIRLAARVLEMVKEFRAAHLEEGLLARLAQAKSNDSTLGDGAAVYRQILAARAEIK